MSADVSVVVTCYDYGRFLDECLESVAAQTLLPGELIIVDDGSPDDSYAIAKRFAERAHPFLCTVITQKNSGTAAAARNRGARDARGAYVMFLDADDALEPDYIAATHAALEADVHAGFAYTDRRDVGDVDAFVPSLPFDLARLARANYVNCCALMRRAAFDAVGGYATDINGMEDWDLWLSLGERGYRGAHIAQTLFRYRRHGGGLFAHAEAHKTERIARIVTRHPALYHPDDVRAAELVTKQCRLARLQERLRRVERNGR